MSVSDNNLQLPELVCQLSQETVRDFIVALKNTYSELLKEESEEN